MMAAKTPAASLVPVQPVFTGSERLGRAVFPAGYRGLTRRGLHLGPAPVHRLVPGRGPCCVGPVVPAAGTPAIHHLIE